MTRVEGGPRSGLPPLADDTRAEELIGQRDLTRWPTAAGRALVHLVGRLAAGVSAHTVLYATLLVGLVTVVGFAAGGAAIYESVVENDGISRLDQPALDAAITLRTPTNTELATGFTHLGGPIGMTVIASLITVAMVWRWRSRTPLVLLLLIATAGSLLMTNVGKVIARPGPAAVVGGGAPVRVRILVPVRAHPEQHGDRRGWSPTCCSAGCAPPWARRP